jgi:DNA ligase (NAD+)
MLTPIALLDPVDVGGVTISRATLHNEDEARKKDVRPGDKVRVARAGDVIPEVVELVKAGQNRGNQFEMPRKCPVCGSKVVREGAYYFCPSGLSCPAQIAGKIIHYASRPAMDIGGLGEKTVKEMVQKKMVKDISQLYDLTKEDLLQLEGFAEKSARQLYEAIQNAKNPDLTRFIYALGIRHVGEHIAGVLAENFKDIESLMKASSKDLQNISEIGPEIARSIEAFFSRKENLNIIKRLESHGIKFKKKHRKEKSKSLEGKTFVFSGKLQNYTRDEAKKAVERLGAKAASSVSGNTDYLVAGENPGSKLNKARDENVKILEEKAFEEILETITKSTNTVVPNF